jgi:hypothetical protein
VLAVGLSRAAADHADATDYLQQAARLCAAGPRATRALVNLGAAHFRLSRPSTREGIGDGTGEGDGDGTDAAGAAAAAAAADWREASLYWQEALEPGVVAVGPDGLAEASLGASGCGPGWASKSSPKSSPTAPGGEAAAEGGEGGEGAEAAAFAAVEALLLKASALASVGEVRLALLPPPVAAAATSAGVAAKAEAEAEAALVGCLETLRALEALVAAASEASATEAAATEAAAAGAAEGAAAGTSLGVAASATAAAAAATGAVARVRTAKGRALRGLASLSHRRGDAVSAEGFYRAAFAELTDATAGAGAAAGAGAEKVPAEVIRCMAGFASLLRAWDGRGSEAAAWARRAEEAEAQPAELCGMFALPGLAELAMELEK